MGNCFRPNSKTSEGRRADKEKRQQIESIRKINIIFKDSITELERITDMLLVKIQHAKRYRGWAVDKVISEIYYKNLIPPKELQNICSLYKSLAEKVAPLINAPDKQPEKFSMAEGDLLVQEMKENHKKLSSFVEAAARIPIIPEKLVQPSNSSSIQEFVPALARSQSIH